MSTSTPGRPGLSKPLLWGVRAALLAVSGLASLAAAEIGLRAADFGFAMYPQAIQFGYPDPDSMRSEFELDEQLLWTPKRYDQLLERARRRKPQLVLMGCSCTAWGEFDKNLLHELRESRGVVEEAREDGEPPESLGVRIENFAVPGWSSYQGRQQLVRDVLPLAPKVVTLFYGWNDHWIGFGVEDDAAGELVEGVKESVLEKHRDLRVVQAWAKLRMAFARGGNDARPLRVPLDKFEANLREMVRLAKAQGVQTVLLTAPTNVRAGDEPNYLAQRHLPDVTQLVPIHASYVEAVRKVAREEQALLCDLAAHFDTLPAEELNKLIMKDGVHFTRAGGRRVGRLLFECFRDNGLFERMQ